MAASNDIRASGYDVFAEACPSRQVFEQISSKWGLLVLARLSDGPLRFRDLYRAIGGISERMLSTTLKKLEESNLVLRREREDTPRRVEYHLAASGSRLSEGVGGLIDLLYAELERENRSAGAG